MSLPSMQRLAQWVAPWITVAVSACSGGIAGSDDMPGSAPLAGSSAAAPVGPASSRGGGGGSGVGASAGAGSAQPLLPDACVSPDTGRSVLRRLSREEYRLTLQQLFQLSEPPAIDQVPEDAEQGGFRTIAAIQGMSDQHLLAYLEVAERLGAELMADAARRASVIGCEVTAADCLQAFIGRFGRLAFRRALSAEESMSLASAAVAGSADASDAVRFAIEALLTSPSFLFRVEAGDATALAELTPSELASRLSFLLWGRGPSAALLDRAAAGELATTQGVLAVAQEMLTAPEARASVGSFFKQWLHFEQLRVPTAPPPGFSEALLPDMIGETERLLEDFAWQPGVRFTDALAANYTYLTPALGAFYGLDAPGPGFSRVDFPAGHPRAGTGVLTHASVISSKTDADLISHRGAFLRDALLCHELTIPSDLQAEIQSSVAGLSYLEVIALRNTEQPCAGCHSQIDPIGVAFASFDAIGHHDASVDASVYALPTRFPGLEAPDFTTLAELAGKLAAAPAVGDCIAQKLFVYTHGRTPDAADACALSVASQRLTEAQGQLPAILAAFVEAPGFRLRRTE